MKQFHIFLQRQSLTVCGLGLMVEVRGTGFHWMKCRSLGVITNHQFSRIHHAIWIKTAGDIVEQGHA